MRISFFIVFSILCVAATMPDRTVPQNNFGTGEHLEYKVHYGFISAAEAVVDVADNIQTVNNHPCFKVSVAGQTVGAFGVFTKVRDSWTSYIDTSSLLPHQFYEKKQEGDYRKEERVTFDHQNNTVKSEEFGDADKDKKQLKVPDNVQDLISGYYFLRTIDFSKMQEGQSVTVKAFYDDEVFDMKMKYQGHEVIKTKFGKMNTLKISPILPKNKFFSGDDPVSIWVSDDQNRIPVKASVSLAIGSLGIDLKKYQGLKTEPQWN